MNAQIEGTVWIAAERLRRHSKKSSFAQCNPHIISVEDTIIKAFYKMCTEHGLHVENQAFENNFLYKKHLKWLKLSITKIYRV